MYPSYASYPESWLEALRVFPLDSFFPSLTGQVPGLWPMPQVEGRGERNTVFCSVRFHLSWVSRNLRSHVCYTTQ